MDGSEPIQITKQGGFEPVESLDGQWVYYTQDRGSSYIWRIPATGGEEKPVFDFHQKNYSRLWAIDREGVYFAALDPRAGPVIGFFNFLNGAVRTIAEINGNLPNSVSGLTISPDGKTLLVPTVAQPGSDLVMIENFR